MTTTAAAPITISGLASGLNTSSIIQQLVTAESSVNTGLETSVSALQSQLTAWQTFNTDLLTLQLSATSLGTASLYNTVQAASSDTSVASATTSAGATAGNHVLTVNNLATSQEVLSQSFTSSTSAIGAAGTISLNGAQIAITSGETLSSIASAINNSNAGVNATVLNVGTGDSQLSLTSSNTGTVNAISAYDVSGNALESLGFVPATGQTPTIRQLTTSTGATDSTVSSTENTGLSASSGFAGSLSINGTVYNIGSNTTGGSSVGLSTLNQDIAASGYQASVNGTSFTLTSTTPGALNPTVTATNLGYSTAPSTSLTAPLSTVLNATGAVSPGTGNSVAGSIALNSATTAIGSQIGYATGGGPNGSFSIDGTTISGINLATASLTDVANAINQAGITGISAQVVASSSTGSLTSPQQLQIVSSAGALTPSDFSDPSGILSAIGVTQTAFSNQVSQASDASFTLDGVAYTRSSNNVTDALSDTTLGLQSTGTTNISVTQDTSAITTAIQGFVTSYNAVNDYVNSQFAFTPNSATETSGTAQASPPLFGNQTLSNAQQQLANAITVSSGGLSLQSVGLSVGQTGDLSLNSNTLSTALATNATGVANLFGQTGSATSSSVQYVGAGANTQTTATGYAINITQPATQAVVTATTAAAANLTAPETLTFSGTSFPSGNISLTLNSGNTLLQTISQINSDNQLNGILTASQDTNGDLVLTSTGYGAAQSFTVTSNVAGSGGSGIGTTGLYGSGLDVAGTIGGEAATGLGQTLIGNSANVNTAGLELDITATAPGSYGSVTVTNGVGDGLNQLLNNLTNSSTGSIASAEAAINTEITTDQAQETSNATTISNYQSQLETEFANMETQVANLQAQGNALTAEVNGNAGSTSSSTSTTKTAS